MGPVITVIEPRGLNIRTQRSAGPNAAPVP
jgi:hypothetical protein